ncbi:MAG: M20/M25/M40 family metallo-hydrolase [Anaerolineales bacterium]|nr:M20/M25/M40 family metallo-hydrolase [Chloroflexota bacterium]MBL6981928.1 M20/M25/M40 family metallo-hydrolase [Anaerolineales bacterium]
MKNLSNFLIDLISSPGLSGYEAPTRQLIEDAWKPFTDQLSVSQLGSLHGLKQGSHSTRLSVAGHAISEPRPSILFATHMDAIGLMVSKITDGFLNLSEIGGLDHRVLPGQLVTVHGREKIPGLIVQPPAHLLHPDIGNGPVPLENLLVDTGLLPNEVNRKVRIGDLISFAQEPIKMGKGILVGHSLDNRASVAALTHCLELLSKRTHPWDVWAVATVQEEETMAGALTSAFQLRPKLAVAIDVTWAQGPDTPKHNTYLLGKGITLGWGPNIHPRLKEAFADVADRLEIPYKLEAMPRHSGTDAYALQIARQGIPTMVVSIPLRYMHTPVEMIAMKDVKRAGRLLAEFVTELDVDFAERISRNPSAGSRQATDQ